MRRLAIQYKRTMDKRTQMIMKTLDKHPEYKNKIIDLDKLTPIY